MDSCSASLLRLYMFCGGSAHTTEEAKTVAVEEGNLAQVGKLLLSAQDDAVVVRLTEVVGDLARVGTLQLCLLLAC